MSIYVQKSLGTGPFRFAAMRRRELASIDDDAELSTGPNGEFNRHRDEIFFSADRHKVAEPMKPGIQSISGMPFLSTLVDGTNRGYVFLGLMLFGVLLALWGMTLLVTKGPQGWVLIIFGLILLATPVVLTANKRRLIREEEERTRREREEREQRNRALLGAYATSLDELRANPNDAALKRVRVEREKLDMPYAAWRNTGRATVLMVGFDALTRLGPEGASEIATLMDRASDAAGLIDEDSTGAKRDLYSTILWHLLADDRLGRVQTEMLRKLQRGLNIDPNDVPLETTAEAQFERLRGVDHRRVPRANVSMPLNVSEYAVHAAKGTLDDGKSAQLFVTNKRLLVDTESRLEIPLRDIDQIEVDGDRETVVIQAANTKKPLFLKVEQPIYTAALLDLAASLDERPKGFA